MQIEICSSAKLPEILMFQEKYLSTSNNAIYSKEFTCPLGLKSSVKRQEVIVTLEKEEIVGIARFYRTKRYGYASLYQFAIVEHYRGNGLLKMMLHTILNVDVVSQVPHVSSMNDYFFKTGWELKSQNNKFKYWVVEAKFF